MVGEAAKKNLYDAATKGEVDNFRVLLQEYPYLLDEVSFACGGNLLHVATMCGQEGIVGEVLKINPRLAMSLDSKRWSPLHIAAAQGSPEIAKKLLSIAPEACWWRDCHDMNPVHVAAMNGHIDVLNELLQESTLPAMERVYRGQTVLHLCLKHGRLRTLIHLLIKLPGLAAVADDDGETLLHLAVWSGQLEPWFIEFLVRDTTINRERKNSMGKTALDILDEIHQDSPTYSETRKILYVLPVVASPWEGILPEMTEITMVVVVLIATMAFQAAISPPGGVWEESKDGDTAGQAVMASTNSEMYKHFVNANTTAFVASFITIMLITTGLPLRHFLFQAVATTSMWLSLTSIAVGYGASLIMTTPNENQSIWVIIAAVVIVFLSFVMLLFLYQFITRKKRPVGM